MSNLDDDHRSRPPRWQWAAGAIVVAAAIAVPAYLVGAGDEGGGDHAARVGADPTAVLTSSGAPSSRPSTRPSEVVTINGPEPGEVDAPGGLTVVGEWEQGRPLGDEVVLGRIGEHEEILYAARRSVLDPGDAEPHVVTYVAVGVRAGGRVLRTVQALVPDAEEAADGIDLYGGDRVDLPWAPGTYRLVGAASGDAAVSVAEPQGGPRAPTISTSGVLPGYTVFVDGGDWQDGWDPVRLAPLTVSTDAGAAVAVRERSWTG